MLLVSTDVTLRDCGAPACSAPFFLLAGKIKSDTTHMVDLVLRVVARAVGIVLSAAVVD
eukprot:SAG11_NODE_25502_length_358_cov_0.602317_2_plen_58_part_01